MAKAVGFPVSVWHFPNPTKIFCVFYYIPVTERRLILDVPRRPAIMLSFHGVR